MLEREQAEEEQAELLRRVAARDAQALAAFYDQTAAPLYSVAVRILGDGSEAEEVIQDAFVQIWEKATTFDPMLGSAFHWALSIARHRSIDRLRARARQSRLLTAYQEVSEVDPPSMSGPEQSAGDAEEFAAVRAALVSLPTEQKQAIEMAFFGGKTHLEIAEALKAPLGTIKARIRRGMLKLRENLQTSA